MNDDRKDRGRQRRVPPPLDETGLRDMALAYAARFATTRANLARYLARKLKERGWAGTQPPDTQGLIDRLAELAYVSDANFAAMKERSMTARGLGPRRIAEALGAAGVAPDDRGPVPSAARSIAAAVTFARRKRLGPFARTDTADPSQRQKSLAAMVRGGHALDIARRVLSARSIEAAEALAEDSQSEDEFE